MWIFSDCLCARPTTYFYSLSSGFPVVDQLIIMTHSNLGLLPNPNAESGESARPVVVGTNKEVVVLL